MSDISPLTFLSQDSLLTQFKLFAKNIQEALPANSDAAKAIADQVQSIERYRKPSGVQGFKAGAC